MGGYTPTRVETLVEAAAIVAAGAAAGSGPRTQQVAVVVGPAAGRCIGGAGNRWVQVHAVRSSVIESYC